VGVSYGKAGAADYVWALDLGEFARAVPRSTPALVAGQKPHVRPLTRSAFEPALNTILVFLQREARTTLVRDDGERDRDADGRSGGDDLGDVNRVLPGITNGLHDSYGGLRARQSRTVLKARHTPPMGMKLVVLVGLLAIAGAIVVASWKPWESSGGSNFGGTKITSYATCVKSQRAQNPGFGPSLLDSICRGLGWTPP
jgi:hypothetical protein